MIEKMDRENQKIEKIDNKRSEKIDNKRRLTAPDFPEVAASYVRETIHLVKSIETRFLELGARLYKIRTDELWLDSHDSYFQFIDDLHIKQSFASMLVKIHQYYVVDGGLEHGNLFRIGYSNLYQAIPLIERDGIKVALAKAETLTRSEIVEEVKEQKYGVHEHAPKNEARWAVCECGKFIPAYG